MLVPVGTSANNHICHVIQVTEYNPLSGRLTQLENKAVGIAA